VKTYFEGVGGVTVAGPFIVKGPGVHALTRKAFQLSSVRFDRRNDLRGENSLHLARHAYRRPVTAVRHASIARAL